MDTHERRQFLLGTVGAGLLLAGCTPGATRQAEGPTGQVDEEDDVAPPEDLMREHGVLNRILLIYDECSARLDKRQALPAEALAKSADIIHRFIEQYHEKLEEDFLFPRFEKAGKLVDLVATLRRQHQAGRTLTDTILRLSTTEPGASEADQKRLVDTLRSFVRMYRPHEAREDTVLFPALRSVVTAKEFHDLGEQFEDKEHALFGKEGFEGIVQQVEVIERTLGISDLNQFTPV